MTAYGFVGTGEITAAIVEGLSVESPPEIFLSPRGRSTALSLASRFPHVTVCASNQEVLESAPSIVLAVRPQVAREVLGELSFRPDHVVISAVAGVQVETLRALTGAGEISRVIPLPSASSRSSLTAMYPESALARSLFESVGSVVVPESESALEAFSAATATVAAHLDYLSTIAAWLAEQGVDPEAATTYVAKIFGPVGVAVLDHTGPFETLISKYKTPGGINEQIMLELREEGVPDTVRHALDRVLTRLRG
jgi:pyrroline-5-carboxylate reductase